MEGAGIWILIILFYLLQAITKNKQRKRRAQEKPGVRSDNKSTEDLFNRSIGNEQVDTDEEKQSEKIPEKPQENVSFEDLFNPEKLRDIFGVPQQKPVRQSKEKAPTKSVVRPKTQQQVRKKWENPEQTKTTKPQNVRKKWSDSQPVKEYFEPEYQTRETGSKVASADITDVDETSADFKSDRLSKSDVTSDRFDTRKTAPGKQKPQFALEYFDEPEDVRNAVVLKEILDRPRAFRRNIR